MSLAMPVLSPSANPTATNANQRAQTIALSGTSQNPTTPLIQGQIVLLSCDTNCWWSFGQVAVIGGAGSTLLTPNTPTLVKVPSVANAPYPGQGNSGTLGQVSFNAIGTTGNLCITPMVNN